MAIFNSFVYVYQRVTKAISGSIRHPEPRALKSSVFLDLPDVRCLKVEHIWVNYNDLTATSLEIMVNKGNHPQMALIQVSEIL